MESMFLREVEEGSGSGPFSNMIKMMRQGKATVPQIMHLFAFKWEATKHLAEFSQAVMRGPSPLAPWVRELIASFTSKENHCPF